MKITNDIKYVGVNDHKIDLFEGQYVVPNGMAYNSYVILDDKIAVMDTVDASFTHEWLDNLQNALNGKSPDYLIVQHMEPDHSANIANFVKAYPNAKIVSSVKAFAMMKQFFGTDFEDKQIVVKEGDTLTLGKHTLAFVGAPMVHWPEVMVTYSVEDKLLFSADAFGCFGTLDGAVLDTELNLDKYYTEMVRYYACIVGKYGAPVQTALKKLGGLEIKMICSTHGPVWTDHISEVIGIYDRLSKYETESGVVIAYGSMYGHTEEMAEMVARGAASVTKNVVLHDVSRSDHSYILADIFRYKGLICGSPTYCGELYPNVASLLAKIKTRGVKNHEFGCFGSFTWANATTKPFEAFAEAMKWEITGSIEVKQSMTAEQAEALYELGRAVALKTMHNS